MCDHNILFTSPPFILLTVLLPKEITVTMPSTKDKKANSKHSKHSKHSDHSKKSKEKEKDEKKDQESSEVQIHMMIYIFRGAPDVYSRRHVLLYFQCPDTNYHETVHVQRDTEGLPWVLDRFERQVDWWASATYISYVDAGSIIVAKGEER